MDVLKAYVSLLIRDQQTELVASYVSQLPADLATVQYAAFLETVSQPELRPRCLQLATDAGETQKPQKLNTNHVGLIVDRLLTRRLCRSGCCRGNQAGGGERAGERRHRVHAPQPDAGDWDHEGTESKKPTFVDI